ncbi:MAG TPA: hypothetical protein PLS90_09950 [Candidatus Sumerlaeota bacterium]|nr:hypothetical protein [Candidatus Sumerlaeota bacterium]HPK02764.1 hypothetical protein [Candidatus Sumerlaeota bacterium]
MFEDPGALALQLESVKQLYGELFLLLSQSIEEDPLTQATGGVDHLIEPLMLTVAHEMSLLRDSVDHLRAVGRLPADLNESIEAFNGQLTEGLRDMADRIDQRTRLLAAQRDEFRERLRLVQRKHQGARGYRRHAMPGAALDSEF